MNDLYDKRPIANAIAYADNLIFHMSCPSATNAIVALQQLIDTIYHWANDNGLVLNICKCYYMLVPPSKKSSIVIHKEPHTSSVPLKRANVILVLGIAITFDLSWSVHAAGVRAKINKMHGVLARFGHSLGINTRCTVFISAVRPHLTYA